MGGTGLKIGDAFTDQKKIFPDSMEKKEIARAAYAMWQSRGCPFGSPERDWFHAERELRTRRLALILDDPPSPRWNVKRLGMVAG